MSSASPLILAMFLRYFTNFTGVLPEEPVITPATFLPATLTVSVQEDDGAVSVAPGAQRVPMLMLRLRASCAADVSVRSLTVQRKGLGDNQDIQGVYLMNGLRRISRVQSIGSRDGTVSLRTFSLVVPACESKEVSVLVDIDPDASPAGEHRFVLTGAGDIDAEGAVVRIGTPISDAPAVRRTVGDTRGTISVTYLSLVRRISYGSRKQVARLRLEADNIDDHLIHAVTLTNQGSARWRDLQNLYVVSGTNTSETLIALDGDRVRFVFEPPLFLAKNSSRNLDVRANVRASRSRTVQLIVEEPGDIESEVVRGRRSDS